MKLRTTVRWAAVTLLMGSLACGPPDSGAVRGEEGPVVWRLGTVPRVTIGVVDGDERYQFVRVAAAWKDSRSRIVVLDPGKPALAFYDSAGAFLAQTGSRGEGPGEFQVIVQGWPYRGDSIATYDFILRRVSVFDADGRFSRSFSNPVTYTRKPGSIPSQSCCAISGVFADGSFAGHPPDDVPNGPGPPRHSILTLLRVSPDGTRQDTLGRFDSARYGHDSTRPNGIHGYATSYSFRYAIVGNDIYGGNGLETGLLAIKPQSHAAAESGLERVTVDTIPLPRATQEFTAELRSAYEASLRADYEARGSQYYEGSLESNMPHAYPPTAPGFVNILADAEGRIWVQRWSPDYGRQSATIEYDVIGTSGRHVASITIPSGAQILWSGAGQIILLQLDDLGVQHVRLYDILTAAQLTSSTAGV